MTELRTAGVITARWWIGFVIAIAVGIPGAVWALSPNGDQTIGFIGTLPAAAYVVVTIVRLRGVRARRSR